MRTLIVSLTTALGLACLAAAGPANAGTLPVTPKAHLTTGVDANLDEVHWRHHRRNYAYYPRYRYYDDYSYSYPRYRSYGYYGVPGFSLHIGPQHRWGHHRRW